MKSGWKKIATVICGLIAAYAAIAGLFFILMLQSPDTFAGAMKHVPWPAFAALPFKPMWQVARRGRVSVGDMAPDFSLEAADHKSRFQLSSLRGEKPVVLVFGSYT
jgi:hypothetical protein